ncbi:MAG: hypothetical protein MMC23_002241 [Stictis urceolatum]|nr:hypothetical protein [Stictis urceolata]
MPISNAQKPAPTPSKAVSRERSQSPTREVSQAPSSAQTCTRPRSPWPGPSPDPPSSPRSSPSQKFPKSRRFSTATTCNSTATPAPPRTSNRHPIPLEPLPYLRRKIHPANGIYILYTLSFLSASLDAASFTAWTAFLNMQTGNTIFLALGASGQPLSNPYAWITALGSISSFILASHLFGALAKTLGVRSRLSLGANFVLQALCTLLAAVLIEVGYIPVPHGRISPADESPGRPEPKELAAIIPLAFAAAGQVGATRELGFSLVPTLVLTTIYADAFRDTRVWRVGTGRGENPVRSKMLITIVMFICGAAVGGWVSRSGVGMGAVVWAGFAWRVVVSAVWAGWRWEERPEEVEGEKAGDGGDDVERGRPRTRSEEKPEEKRRVIWAGNSQAEKEMRDMQERKRDRELRDGTDGLEREKQRELNDENLEAQRGMRC